MARKNGKTTKQRQADKAARAAAAPPKPEAKKREDMSAQEVKQMRAAGQQRRDNRAKKTIRAAKQEQQAKRDANGAARSAAYKDPTGLGISRKDVFKMQGQALQGPETWSSPNLGRGKGFAFDDEQGWYPSEGQINYAMYGGKEYLGQKKTSSGDWKKVQKALGIRTVDKPEDLARMFNFVNGASTGVTRKSGRGGSGAGTYDRSSGEFGDIKGALGEDAQAGRNAASDLDNREVNEANAFQEIIDGLMASDLDNREVNEANAFQEIIDGLMASNTANQTAFEDQLSAQAASSAASLANLNDLFVGQLGDVQSRMAQQQEDFNTAQAFTNEQLNAANNAFLQEQRRSANMANAYVPQANPNAFSIGYGDGRASRRKREDNQLSDLTLMSGLGTMSNPLAGLQLA
jgi:hypothetical protein